MKVRICVVMLAIVLLLTSCGNGKNDGFDFNKTQKTEETLPNFDEYTVEKIAFYEYNKDTEAVNCVSVLVNNIFIAE